MPKQEDQFRTLDPEDEALLETYATLIAQQKSAEEAAKSLRDRVLEILMREDTEKTLVHQRFAYEVTYRKTWNPKIKNIEREIDVNGQFIQCTVGQLDSAKKRLENLLKTPEMEGESTVAITARLL